MKKATSTTIDQNGPCITITPAYRTRSAREEGAASAPFRFALESMEKAIRAHDGAALWECLHAYIERKTRRELVKRMGFGLKGEISARTGAHYEELRAYERPVFERDGWMKKRVMDDATGEMVLKSVPRWVPTGEMETVVMPWENADEWADIMQSIAMMLIEMAPLSVREKGKPARLVPLASIIDERGAMRCYWALVNRAFEIAVKAYGLDRPRNLPMTDGYGASSAGAESEWLRVLKDENAALDLEIAERRADAPRTQAAGLAVLHGLRGAERDYLADALMGLQASPAARKARQRMVARLQVEAKAGLITEETFEAALRTMKTWIHALA